MLQRRITAGIRRLDEHLSSIESLEATAPHGGEFIWRVSQWVDAGWACIDALTFLLERIPTEARSRLPLYDYAAVRMAQGMAAMSLEDPGGAITHFSLVLALSPDLADAEVTATAHFWRARCHRKKGEYDDALEDVLRARDFAVQSGFEQMAAVIRVLESWIYFQKGRHGEALKTLAECESVLASSGDAISLGHIQSTYGRIYRQEGRYDRAIRHFNNAIAEYRKLGSSHPNLARTLANMAYVQRLVALEFRKKVDAEVARRRQSGGGIGAGVPSQARERFAELRDEAFANLNESAAIYRSHPNHRGLGTVHLNRGLLYLDNGDLDLAGVEGASAFSLGEEKEDTILMARARILQCMVENAKVEEGLEQDPRPHAESALDYVRDALALARKTQNRRLLARVHTWHGLTLANEFFLNHEAASEALSAAASCLDHGYHDTAWDDFQALRSRVIRSNSVDQRLHAWSQGAVGDKSFREISEEFAQIIIPKVWELEGRKVARVAAGSRSRRRKYGGHSREPGCWARRGAGMMRFCELRGIGLRIVEMEASMNWFDTVLIAAVVLGVIEGSRKGFSRAALGFITFLIAVGGAFWFYAPISFWLRSYMSKPAANGTALVLVFVGIMLLGCLASRPIAKAIDSAGLRWPDRILGAGFGVIEGLFSATMIVLVFLAFGPHPLPRAVVDSRFLPYLDGAAHIAASATPLEVKAGFQRARRDLDKVVPPVVGKGIDRLVNSSL